MTSMVRTWTRRLLVIALYGTAFLGLTAAFVPLGIATATYDFVRGQAWTLTRTLVFFVWYFGCELAGIAASLVLWLASGMWVGAEHERFRHWNFSLQHWWARMLGRGGFRIFDIRVAPCAPFVELPDGSTAPYRFGVNPVIIFVRHASAADTILTAVLVSVPYGTRLRYVLKRELLWDPCLDIVGNRLPNVFVRRDSAQTEREVAAVAALADGLGPNDGVLIYPEGTRFSPSKRKRIVEKLHEQGREDAAREAESLRHVLRPRSGGPLALLERAPEADVVFLAHTGFEGSASFDRFFNGGLIGKTVHAEIRVVRAADVPNTPLTRRTWMMEQWRRVDDFIERNGSGR